MLNKTPILFGLCLITASIYAQQNSIKPEDAKLANNLKAKYIDSDVVAITSKSAYTFDINTSSSIESPVVALETATDNLIAVKDNCSFSNAVFYDFQSEVLKLSAKGLRGRPIPIAPIYKNYESSGIFSNDVKMCIYSFSFDTRGEKVESEYQKRYYDVKYLTSVYFHESFPIDERVISFEIPDWLNIELKEMNFEGYSIDKKSIVDTKKKITLYTYTAKNLQARKSENHAPACAKNYPHILVLCKKYQEKNGNNVNLLNSTDDLYAWYASLCEKIGNKNETLRPLVTKLTEGKKTDIEKIEALYYWVQENIRYIAFEDGIMGFKPEAAQNVCKNKYGDCKGKANLLKELLITAGYDARLTWIGTSDIPYDYSIPSLAVDNHMICTLILNGKRYFLDGTEDYIAFNDYAHRIQGRPVLIEDGPKYILDKIPSYSGERNKLQTNSQISIVGDILKGRLQSIYNGEEKTNILRGYTAIRSDKKEESLKKYFTSGDKNVNLTNLVTSDLQDRQSPLSISYDFELHNYITQVGNEMYVMIDKEKEFEHFDFDSTRVNDYEFNNKILRVSHIELTVPGGYKIDYLPDPVNKTNPDFSFSLSYSTKEDKIIYDKRITIDNALIRKKDFKTWNSFVKEAKKFYNDQIILVKK